MVFRGLVLWAALAFGCGCGGTDNDEIVGEAGKNLNCNSAPSYTAFDPANHANQDARVQAQADMAAAAEAALADPGQAAEAFATIEGIYVGTADLAEKVKGRADDHFPGDAAAAEVGAEIDAFIVGAIARGKAATTALEVDVAKEIIDKSLTRFFYLSVYHELVQGAREKHDEAFGYLGIGADGDADGLRAVAKVASRRDGNGKTDYAPRLLRGIIDGACALDTALGATGASSLEWTSDAAYAKEVRAIDETMQQVLAASVGHEMFEPVATLSIDEATVKLHEAAHFFFAIEAVMRDRGGEAAGDATAIRTMLLDAIELSDAGDASWTEQLDSTFIRDRVAAAFEITVEG